MRRFRLACFVTAGCVVGLPAFQLEADVPEVPPEGTVVWHNGSLDSSPAGTGDVDVRFEYRSIPHRILARFSELAALEIDFGYPVGDDTFLWATSYLANRTGVAWTGFEIVLEGADFAGMDFTVLAQAPDADPVVDTGFQTPDFDVVPPECIGLIHAPLSQFSLSNSTITRFNPEGSSFTDSKLALTFDNPVQSGKGFYLWYNVIPSPGAAGATGFTMSIRPTPEPATAALLALATLVALRRRRKML